MDKNRINMALMFPLLAVLTIVGFGGGLGVIFILLNETALGELGVIALGIAMVVGVPSVAALIERKVERR